LQGEGTQHSKADFVRRTIDSAVHNRYATLATAQAPAMGLEEAYFDAVTIMPGRRALFGRLGPRLALKQPEALPRQQAAPR
jgi:hypothetical protein